MANWGWLTHLDNIAARTATTLAVTSANANYPATNLKLLPITKVWRSAAAALSSVDITYDFGSAHTIELVALVNHNLTSAATIAIAAGTTTGYGDFSTTMTWREFDAFEVLSPAQSYRYWRIRLTDAANTDNYLEVGYPMLGDMTVAEFQFLYGWTQTDAFENQVVRSEFGVAYVEEMYYQMRFRLNFGPLPAADMATLRELYRDLKGSVTPFLFLPDTAGADAYLVRFANLFTQTVNFYRYATCELNEESRGKRIAA